MTGEDRASVALPGPDAVRAVVRACGLAPDGVSPLAQGVTCVAWRANTDAGDVAVRIERPERPASTRNAPANFEAQAALAERLRDLGVPVPRPLATDRSPGIDDPLAGRFRWAVDEFAEGEPLDRAGTPPDALRDLGAALAALHALPVEGYGLLEDRRDALRGGEADVEAGLLSRWRALWPFDGSPLIAHPIARVAPGLLGPLGAMREQLLRYVEPPAASNVAVCHGDLHAAHILVRDRSLAALLDFGDAFVAHPAWDIASFAHHHGWAPAGVLLEGYQPKRVLREVRLAEAQQLAVALALQKVAKWHGRDDARVRRMVAFLEQTLPLAVRRDA